MTYLISTCRSRKWSPDLDALFHDAHVLELLLLGVGLAADVAVFGVGHVAVGEGDFAGCGYAAAAAGGLGVARYGAANLKPDLGQCGLCIQSVSGLMGCMISLLHKRNVGQH